MRKQLSAPVSLMAVVIGFALVYYAFHSNGWNWDGEATLAYLPVTGLGDRGYYHERLGLGEFLQRSAASQKITRPGPAVSLIQQCFPS